MVKKEKKIPLYIHNEMLVLSQISQITFNELYKMSTLFHFYMNTCKTIRYYESLLQTTGFVDEHPISYHPSIWLGGRGNFKKYQPLLEEELCIQI